MIETRGMVMSFTDLRVWQSSRVLVKLIYIETAKYPSSELYSLVSQMRRAVISTSSNIAEGFGRTSSKDREHFYVMASGSLYELKNQLILSCDLEYINETQLQYLTNNLEDTHKQLHALLKSHRNINV